MNNVGGNNNPSPNTGVCAVHTRACKCVWLCLHIGLRSVQGPMSQWLCSLEVEGEWALLGWASRKKEADKPLMRAAGQSLWLAVNLSTCHRCLQRESHVNKSESQRCGRQANPRWQIILRTPRQPHTFNSHFITACLLAPEIVMRSNWHFTKKSYWLCHWNYKSLPFDPTTLRF